MNKRPRNYGSAHGRRQMGRAGTGTWVVRNSQTGRIVGVGRSGTRVKKQPIFVGPSVDGVDMEFVEIVSGKVSDRKPSFAR
jgi:hypothetical protein